MIEVIHESDGAPAEGAGARAQKIVNLTGATVSLALVLGMGVWGYKLMVRDVSGVPVIEALEGAFRTEPEEPGGMQTPHQGLEVNEIAAVGSASGPAEEVHLAPDPEILASEDAPWGELLETIPDPATGSGAEGSEIPDSREVAVARPAPGEGSPEIDDQPEDALATDLAVAEAMAGIMAEAGAERSLDRTTGSLMVPRPQPRPEDEPLQVSASAGPSGVGAGEVEIDVLSKGTRLVQLGAYEDASAARESWTAIGSRFDDAFADKRMVVQEAESGGKRFFRLRAEGFTDLADARKFCSRLMAAQADCIPVEVR